ncbi:MAG: RluA family pseudouridine synthase [Alphaproteobacteria bacterium]|nr:RluA family pseudouridine synthase [Alphaproteobacteria bacterium]
MIISFCLIADIKKNRLDRLLTQELSNLSRSKIKNLIETGHVFVNKKLITDPNYYLKAKEEITIDYSDNTQEIAPEADCSVVFSILYEDQDIIVINKPAGVVVHPGAGNFSHTLVNGLVYHCDCLSEGSNKSRPGIVHRIDKNTSGILVIAKNDQAHAILAEQFQIHSIKRKYICFCYSVPRINNGKIETQISRDPKNRLKMSVSNNKGKKAITIYKTLKIFSTFAAKIECELHTGRTHQIRVHMSHMGHSLIGDHLYKKKNYAIPKSIEKYINNFPRQALHAYFLEFTHPTTKKTMRFEIELPEDLKELEKQMDKAVIVG